MGRTANKPTGITPDVELPEQALSELQNTSSKLEQVFTEEMRQVTQLIGERIGRRSMAQMITKLLTVTDVIDLQHIKESRKYKGFIHIDEDGKSQRITTWADYCRLVEGKSPESVDLEISNLNQLGEELFDSMRQVGIGPGKMREIRKLPDDARSALIEASKQGNLEAVQYLAEDLIHAHTKEKETLTKTLTDTKADYDAQGSVLANKSAELDKTKQELAKARRQVETLTADERAKELRVEVAALAFEAEADITGKLREGFIKLAEHAEANGVDHRPFQAAMIQQLEALLGSLRSEFQLPDSSGDENFSWMNEPTNTQLPAQDA
ncbi:MAG TPA: hypothetical protein PK873_14365 [Pseudomonas sp.]|uniref:hypothetical protein n=1 Tax=Pseudomonas sp. TaxID=306 RepID=UPI002CF484E6|nr:hypothetical protein [Pseudomonas sp.]HRL94733.1 hypothetical protein [Pseudomonas sp.]